MESVSVERSRNLEIKRENEQSGSVLKVVSPLLEWDCKGNKEKEMCALFLKVLNFIQSV